MDLAAVRTAVADLYAAIADQDPDAAGNLDAGTLLDVVEQAQQVINTAAGIQTHAIAHLAAHDEVRDDEDESGWVWKRHGLGFTAEDTASLVAPRLGVSVPVAQGRVEDAVHQVKVTPRLVDAMGTGDLDLFRAHLITREVMPCTDETAREIVDRLIAHYARTGRWDETAGPLASRTRRLVARLAPDVAAATKEKAVTDRALTRRPVSDAADLWSGLVPVEQSLLMWQAVDHLARELRAANPDLTLDQARLDALHQLVLGQADVTIHLHATHPDNTEGPNPAETTPADADTTTDADASSEVTSADETDCAEEKPGADGTQGPTASAGFAGLAERAIRGVIELGGLDRPGATTVIDLDRLPSCVRLVASTPLGCHPDTGALTTGIVPKALAPCDVAAPPPDTSEARYRPSLALQRLIRLRDGHCRFPGCQIAARFCDLDHVTPWPNGPTTPENLMCLCRRHHRIKQRPGWTTRLDPDGVVHWSDPTGRVSTSHPVNHLDRIHHRPAPPEPEAAPEPPGPATRPTPMKPRRQRTPQTRPALTRAQLAALLHQDPTPPATLAELTLARLLQLARIAPEQHPPALPALDWHHQPSTYLVDLPATGPTPDQPPKDHGPPPF